MAMTKKLVDGDRVQIVSGIYRPNRNRKPLFAKVVSLAGTSSMVTVAFEREGKPIKTLQLKSLALV
jgi:hypothetical protein